MAFTLLEQEMIKKIDELTISNNTLQAKVTEYQSLSTDTEKNEEIKKPFVSLFKEKVYNPNKLAPICLNKLDHLLMFKPKKGI